MQKEEITIKSLEEYYNFRRSAKKICKTHNETEKRNSKTPEYRLQIYPASEDIYTIKEKRFESRRYYKKKAPNRKALGTKRTLKK
jgi:hypothetical protein